MRELFRSRLALTVLSLAIVFFFNPSQSDAQCTECVFPNAEWQLVPANELEQLGWSGEALTDVDSHLRDDTNATGVVVIDTGHLVFQYGEIKELSYVASVRKSILAMLYGRWVENETIDLDQTLWAMAFDDVGGLLPIERQATIRNLITARSGVYHPASNSGDNLADAPERGSKQPGTYMLYSNWDFNAAGAIFESLTGQNIYDELEAQLALPLQFEDWDRSSQRKSGNLSVSRNPAYHMWISTRDLARIGHLMLNEGNWAGDQIISEDWHQTITSVVTPLEEMNPERMRSWYFGYGYMWWLFDGPEATGPFEGAYMGAGAYGQWITVFPKIDLVISHKTNSESGNRTSWESFQRTIELVFEAKGIQMGNPYPWQ